MAPKLRGRKPHLEVVSRVDGAWYDGDIAFNGSRLRVHFNGFGDNDDEFWEGDSLKSTTRFMEIVRLRSKQLQDSQCTQVSVGMVVCANYKTPDGRESKYYDAKLLAIHQSTHSSLKGGKVELCTCRFKIAWEGGPYKHQEAVVGCADISLIDDESVEKHPVAHLVLQAARDYAEGSRAVVPEELEQIPMTENSDELNWHDLVSDAHLHLNEKNDGFFISGRDTEGLPPDIVARLQNFDIFQQFLAKEADRLQEAADNYKTKNQSAILVEDKEKAE